MKKFVLMLAVSLLLVSCKKQVEQGVRPIETQWTQERETAENLYTWYYLDTSGMYTANSVRAVPGVAQRPWTEAVRISCASVASDAGDSAPTAYAIVNRSGVLVFNGADATLYPDVSLFSGNTAGNIVFYNNTPFFSIYKSTFFNESQDSGQTFHPFLAQFSPAAKISSPSLAIENLGMTRESQVVDFVWNGTEWVCSVKTVSGERTIFSYLTWQPTVDILSLTPNMASNSLLINETTQDDFRALKMPDNFENAPLRLYELLSHIPDEVSFYVTCYTTGGHSPRYYIKQKHGDTTLPLSAESCISETWICVVFQDGTVYMNGALYDKPLMNDGNPVAFKLPRLPAGFVYGSCVITDTTLYVAWEETAFYQTGRSGFTCVDLNSILN